jgi:hypothetical protein
MNRRSIIALSAVTVLGLASLPGAAVGEPTIKEQIVGTWTFVSALDVKPDGSKDDRWGTNPKGVFMFDTHGRFAQFITRSDLPKFAGKTASGGQRPGAISVPAAVSSRDGG